MWVDTRNHSNVVGCPLPPAVRHVVHASISPSCTRISLLARDGSQHLAAAMYSMPRPLEVAVRR